MNQSEEVSAAIESSIKLPRAISDPTMISPWKTNTQVRKELFFISEMVPILLTIERALGDHDCGFEYRCFWWSKFVALTAKDEQDARKIVGYLIRAFNKKPKIKKVADDALEAEWMIDSIPITVRGYKPATCHYEEVEIKVPAQRRRVEKKVILAQKARIEKRRILVCDDAKTEPQVAEEVKESSEVPF